MLRLLLTRRYRRAVDVAAGNLLDAFGHLAPEEAQRGARRAIDDTERAFCEAVLARVTFYLDPETDTARG